MNTSIAHLRPRTRARADESHAAAPDAGHSAVDSQLRVGDFRDAVDTLDGYRNELAAAPHDERVRMEAASRLLRHIGIVVDVVLRLPAWYVEDLREARASIDAANAEIARWRRT